MLKLLCCASELPSAVRAGVLPDGTEQVATGFDQQKAAAFLPSCSQLSIYCAPDVTIPDVGVHRLVLQNTLRDRNYGVWAGRALQGMALAEQVSFTGDMTFAPPEGESFAACYQRTASWLASMSQIQSVAVVLARPAIIRNLVLWVLYQGVGPMDMARAARVDVAPRSYSLLTCYAGRWRVGMLAAPA